jgi:hypothetical protein
VSLFTLTGCARPRLRVNEPENPFERCVRLKAASSASSLAYLDTVGTNPIG